MFDLSKEPIFFTSTRLATLALAALASGVIGACFNGDAAQGLPCDDNKQCGPGTECIDGYCAGLFLCADGELVDASDICDDELDCDDESDEDITLCGSQVNTFNQCEEPDGNLAYSVGVSMQGPPNAIKVVAADVQGMETLDMISATLGGSDVRIAFDLGTADPKEFILPGPPPATYGDRIVGGFEIAEVNGDDRDDIVVVTTGDDGSAIYVYQNMAPGPPEQWGTENLVAGVPGAVGKGFEIGRLNEGDAADIVGIVDIGPIHGTLLVGLGDPAVADAGGTYFGPTVEGGPIGYDAFVDSALADIDGDGLDDLLVTGTEGAGPGLWFVRRNLGESTGWDGALKLDVMSPGFIAVGRFMGSPPPGEEIGPRPDVAILSPNDGRIQTMLNMNGVLLSGLSSTLDGAGFTALTIADMNCDGQGDLVYALAEPPGIRVLIGDGPSTLMNDPLVIADEGTPRGGLDVALYDQDSTPDIFTAADAGLGQAEPQLRILVTDAQ